MLICHRRLSLQSKYSFKFSTAFLKILFKYYSCNFSCKEKDRHYIYKQIYWTNFKWSQRYIKIYIQRRIYWYFYMWNYSFHSKVKESTLKYSNVQGFASLFPLIIYSDILLDIYISPNEMVFSISILDLSFPWL